MEHTHSEATFVPVQAFGMSRTISNLQTVGFHEFSHALAGVLTCAKIESIQLDPDEGGATRLRGGISFITLPAGYLGSSLIGAILIACGFDERASKVASIVVGVCFLCMLWWARRNWMYVCGMLKDQENRA